MALRQSDNTKTITIHIAPITYQKLSILAARAETTKGAMASEAIETYIRWLRKTDAEEVVNLTEEEEAIFVAHHDYVTKKQREFAVLRSIKARYPYIKWSHMKQGKVKDPRGPYRPSTDNVLRTGKTGRPRKVVDNVSGSSNNFSKTEDAATIP